MRLEWLILNGFELNLIQKNITMAIEGLDTLEIIEVMENFLSLERPPIDIRPKLDIDYKIENQSVEIFEKVAHFIKKGDFMYRSFAKATFVKTKGHRRVYWMRASGKWEAHPKVPIVSNLRDFTQMVIRDEGAFFKG